MTGGQVSPITPHQVKTLTTPKGNPDYPVDIQNSFRHSGCYFARTTAYHLNHMRKCMVEALKFRGFSFVEARTMCIVNYGRRLGYKNSNEMLLHYKEGYKIKDYAEELAPDEIGIVKGNGKL
jgi:2-oxoglutarate ferredoxin oxidoreductase subunit beta